MHATSSNMPLDLLLTPVPQPDLIRHFQTIRPRPANPLKGHYIRPTQLAGLCDGHGRCPELVPRADVWPADERELLGELLPVPWTVLEEAAGRHRGRGYEIRTKR